MSGLAMRCLLRRISSPVLRPCPRMELANGLSPSPSPARFMSTLVDEAYQLEKKASEDFERAYQSARRVLDKQGKFIEKVERFNYTIGAPLVLGIWATLLVYLGLDNKTSSSAKK